MDDVTNYTYEEFEYDYEVESDDDRRYHYHNVVNKETGERYLVPTDLPAPLPKQVFVMWIDSGKPSKDIIKRVLGTSGTPRTWDLIKYHNILMDAKADADLLGGEVALYKNEES